MNNNLKYKRILLKLSGESLAGEGEFGIDPKILTFFAGEIKKVHSLGVQVGIVIGGGNIYRGLNAGDQGIDRVTGDQMGMLATMINSLALQNTLENHGMFTRLLTAIDMSAIAEPYIRRRAIRLWKREEWLFSVPEQGIPILVQIQQHPYALLKLKLMQLLKAPVLMVYSIPIRKKIMMQKCLMKYLIWMYFRKIYA